MTEKKAEKQDDEKLERCEKGRYNVQAYRGQFRHQQIVSEIGTE